MTERTRNFIVGITVLAGIVGLCVILVLMGSLPGAFDTGYTIAVKINSAAGLNPASTITLNGIKVGKVTDVQLQDPPDFVKVDAVIEQQYNIPDTAYVDVQAPLLGGSPTLAFIVKPRTDGQPHKYLAKDGSATIQGHAAGMVGQFKAALKEPLQKFDSLAVQFEQLSTEWTEVGRNVNRLLGPQSTTEVDQGNSVGNLSTVLQRTDARLAELQSVIAGLDKWVNDQQLKSDIRQSAANINSATARLDTTIDQVNENIDQLTTRYIAVADDLSTAITAFKTVADNANEGDGTMAKILNDPALYNNINDAAQRLNSVLDETKLLIEKWKAEGLPVQF